MAQQTIEIDTSHGTGTAQAIKEALNQPWEISYPWGNERFYGTRTECQTRMRANIRQNDSED